MSHVWRSLRLRLALLGFGAIYLPAVLLFAVTQLTESDYTEVRNGVEITAETSTGPSAWVTVTLVALAPVAAALAWWWAGRAVRPIEHIRSVAEDIEGSDLSRRIGLDDGPAELVALAASFDAMLERLERAAETQRQLIDEASHELRTPLAVLATNADVALAHPSPSLALYREGLERSRSVGDQMRRTIDDLLVDARQRARASDRQAADLMAIAREVVEDARVLAGAKEIELSLAGPTHAVCPLDAATVGRAISNLVDNAIRYAPARTTVAVEVDLTDPAASVRVTDHGPGMAEAEQEHVFERFWRGRENADGSGLGLPIARQIALAHGGELSVSSPGPAGDGCVFVLRLPR